VQALGGLSHGEAAASCPCQRARALRRIDRPRRMLRSLRRRPRLSRSRLRASGQRGQCPEAPAWPPTAAPTRGKQHGSELDAPYPLVAGRKLRALPMRSRVRESDVRAACSTLSYAAALATAT
jgi:hypothetical protein